MLEVVNKLVNNSHCMSEYGTVVYHVNTLYKLELIILYF